MKAPGETESADPAANEPPSIEPPRSWTKEAKERWASLPRETQEYLAEREQERDREFRRSQNEAADKLKGLTAKEQAVEQARQHYESALPLLFQTLQHQQASDFADIKTMADLERLAREDSARYLQWDLAQKRLAHVTQQMVDAHTRQLAEKQQQFSDFAKREDGLFKEKVPDLADEAKMAELHKAALSVLTDLGFEEAELAQSWNGQKELSLRDHRVQLLIRDATLWRDAQAKAKAAAAKPVPPVQRPGVSQPEGAAQEAQVQALTTKLEKSGSLKDAGGRGRKSREGESKRGRGRRKKKRRDEGRKREEGRGRGKGGEKSGKGRGREGGVRQVKGRKRRRGGEWGGKKGQTNGEERGRGGGVREGRENKRREKGREEGEEGGEGEKGGGGGEEGGEEGRRGRGRRGGERGEGREGKEGIVGRGLVERGKGKGEGGGERGGGRGDVNGLSRSGHEVRSQHHGRPKEVSNGDEEQKTSSSRSNWTSPTIRPKKSSWRRTRASGAPAMRSSSTSTRS